VDTVDFVGRAKVDGEKHLSVCIGQESFDNGSQVSGACDGFGTVNGVLFPHEFDTDDVDAVKELPV
jgi:hypothetical protein